MAFLHALTDVLRPRAMLPAPSAAGLDREAAEATSSTGARADGPPPTAAGPKTSPITMDEAGEPSAQEKTLMLHLSNVSHGVNHFQNQMMTMLWPAIMTELGLNYTQVGVLAAISSALNSLCQGTYGLLTPFLSRCKILGVGNVGIALGTLLSGLAGSYPMLIVARGVAAVGH